MQSFLRALLAACLLFAGVAARAENVYIMDLGLRGIYSVDVINGGPATLLTPITPPTDPQGYTLATRPSDGMLFYLDSDGINPNLWRWDPANPTQPPVLVGTPGATTTGVVRLGFDAAGRLLAMDAGAGTSSMWTLDTNTGAIISTTPLSGSLPSQSGDLCLSTTSGVLYMVANTEVYTVTSSGVSTLLGTITGLPATAPRLVTGCAFTANGSMLVSMYNGGPLLRVNIATLAATALPQSTGITTIGDLATAPERVADLSLTKTASNATPGSTVSFTITVANAGPQRTTDVRVQDVLPAGLTLTSVVASQGSYSVAAAGTNPAGTWAAGAIPANGTATLTINANVVAGSGNITNAAQIIYSDLYDPDSTPNNNAAAEDDQGSVTITRSPDLTVSKVANGSFARGVNGTYALSVSNIGSAVSAGTITVTDVLPANLDWVSATGTNWTCGWTAGTRTVSCSTTAGVTLAAGATSTAITLTVKPTADSPDTAVNTATVGGGGEPASNNGNNSSTVTAAVCTTNCPDLLLTKTLSASSMVVGTAYTYTLSVSNVGGLATSGNYTVTDTLPPGLTLAAAPTATGWTCTPVGATTNVSGGTIVSCTRNTVINPGAALPNNITFPVNVLNTAVPQVVNTATVKDGGEPPATQGNNSASLTTPVADFDIVVGKAKSTAGNFAVGTTSGYVFTLRNLGARTTVGTITINDTLPAGMTLATASGGTGWAIGTSWSCAANLNGAGNNTSGSSKISCNYTGTIGANATLAATVTVPVAVAPAAAPSVTNTVTVTNANEAPANTANNSFTLATDVNAPDLVVTKSHNGSFAVGASESYTLTVTNIGAVASSGVITLVDTLPAELNYVSATVGGTGTGWAATPCTWSAATRRITCTTTAAGGALAPNSSANPIVVRVTPTAAAAANSPVLNTATVSGGNEPAGNAGNNTATDPTYVYYPPVIAKSFVPSTMVAGATSSLVITVTNPAGSTASSLVGVAFNDPFPTGLAVAGTPNFSNSCGGSIGSGNAQGDTLISLTGGTVGAAGTSCTISVSVTAGGVGTLTNTTGEVSSTTAGIGNTATATLTTTAPGTPVLTKVSTPSAVGTGEIASLVFTITNKNSNTNNMGFTDKLPAGVVVAGAATHTCTLNSANPVTSVTAALNGNTVTVAGVDLNTTTLTSCKVTVPIKSSAPGSYVNNSTNITGTTTLSATLVNDTLVVQSTTLTKSFSPSAILVNGTSTMALVLTNGPDMPEQNGLAFTETLPPGVVLAQAPSASQCGGTVTGASGGSALALSGGVLAVGQAGCTVTAVVTAAAAGTYNNVDANISGWSVNVSRSVNASLSVIAPVPTLSKTNNQTLIAPGSNTTYVVTVGNSSGVGLSSVVVKDPVVANLSITNATCSTLGSPAPSCPSQTGTALVTALQGVGATIPSLPDGGTVVFTLSAQLTGNPTGTLTNVVTATFNGQTVTAQDSDTIAAPTLQHIKTVAVLRDPLNGTTNPKAIPGAEAMYTITVVNQGAIAIDANTVVVTDSIPPNTELYVGDLALPAGPVGFTASTTPAAGLTLSWDGTATDDVDFSSTAQPGPYLWNYTPVPNGAGYDPAVSAIRLRPKGSLAGAAAAPWPQVQFQFKVRIK